MTEQTVRVVEAAYLNRVHDDARHIVLQYAGQLRRNAQVAPDRFGEPEQRAHALDRWLKGYLANAFTWPYGTSAATLQGLADGLAEVGQP